MSKKYNLNSNVSDNQDRYWDNRYESEGKIWGDLPSPTVITATQYLKNNSRILDIGCGYGRDLSFLIKRGHKVFGIDSSPFALRYIKDKCHNKNLQPENLINKRFEDSDLPKDYFDGIISHRLLHLLVKQDSVLNFVFKVRQTLRKGGILCIGTRSPNDFNPSQMICIGDGIYEYKDRPGHRIRFWDKNRLAKKFSDYFKVQYVTYITEKESLFNPIPCYLTMMICEKS